MNQQQNAALESMKEWLAHPDELGKEPAKIELAGEFDLHELHYYIFKYKKSILGKWLLGVCGGYEPGETEHCGHVFSEMEPYEETTAKEKAIAMIEMIRSYWMEQAQKYDAQERPDILYPAIAASFTPYSRFPLTMMTCSQNISSPS